MIKSLDALVRSNLRLYTLVRSTAVFLCRFILLEEGFSFLRQINPKSGSVALDIGSNDGTSIEMIRQIHPGNLIHSFDPVIPPKKDYRGVEFHNVALSNTEGTLDIYVPTIGKSTLTQYSSSDKEKAMGQLVGDFHLDPKTISFDRRTAPCISLDSLHLDPYFVKVDVEGQEEMVLTGGIETILRSRPVLLIEVQSLEKYRVIRDLLKPLGYFNLDWPQKNRNSMSAIGVYSRGRNNYLWLPDGQSPTWEFRSLR